MIYLDTSALAKLVVLEPETAALQRWLRRRSGQPWVTSIVGRIELVRVANRHAGTQVGARQLLAGVDLIPLGAPVADLAEAVVPAGLRILDALHLASALSVQDELTAFCCYDRQLQDAAAAAGLPIQSPGADPGRRGGSARGVAP